MKYFRVTPLTWLLLFFVTLCGGSQAYAFTMNTGWLRWANLSVTLFSVGAFVFIWIMGYRTQLIRDEMESWRLRDTP